MARRVSHHCSVCGRHVIEAEVCPRHPNATIDSALAGPGRPVTTGSDSTPTINFRASAKLHAALKVRAKRLGLDGPNQAAKRLVTEALGIDG